MVRRQTKEWSAEQDELLKALLENYQKPYPWKQIAREMKVKHNVVGKNFKDCRERYQTYNPLLWNYVKWTEEEEQLLLQKQQKNGNKWFEISHFFPGRKDGFLKNQFYSIFRKALKKANAQVYEYYNNKVRPITKALILKCLLVCESQFNKKRDYPESIRKVAVELKQILINYLYSTFSYQEGTVLVQKFLKTVAEFRKRLKMKSQDLYQQESFEAENQQEQIPKKSNLKFEQEQIPLQYQHVEGVPIKSEEQTSEKRSEDPTKNKTDLSQSSYFQQIVSKIKELNQITVQSAPPTPQTPPIPTFNPVFNNPIHYHSPPSQIQMPLQYQNPILSYQNFVQNPYYFEPPFFFNNRPFIDWRNMIPRYY